MYEAIAQTSAQSATSDQDWETKESLIEHSMLGKVKTKKMTKSVLSSLSFEAGCVLYFETVDE